MSLYLDNVVERYKKAAPKYDQFYNYVYSEKASITVRWLDLSTNDRLADVGGGTGGISTLVWKEASKTTIFVTENYLAIINRS